MMTMRGAAFAGWILAAVLGGAEAAAAPLKVVATTTVLADVAREVGGDDVEVVCLMEPGQDLHVFEPAPSVVRKVAQADVLLASGKGLESYLDKLADSAKGTASWTVVGDKIPSVAGECSHDHDHNHSHGGAHAHDEDIDPHWWQTPGNLKIAAKVTADAMAGARAEKAAAFRQRAAAFAARMDELDKWIRLEVAKIPRERRKIVTAHDAFRYFGKEYGFETFGIAGLSTADQPSAKELAQMVETIRTEGVGAVFREDALNPEVLARLQAETGVRDGGQLLDTGPADDAMGCAGMLRHNVATLVAALAGAGGAAAP